MRHWAAALIAAIAICFVATAAADLKNAQVLLTGSNWKVLRTQDSMTDRPSCVAIWRDNYRIQLNVDALYISYRGRGGISGYRLRFDDEPASELRLATDAESNISALILRTKEVRRLIKAKRLRTSTLTVLRTLVEDDIDLSGILDAHAVLGSALCTSASGWSAKVRP